jgi:hypothetical protein
VLCKVQAVCAVAAFVTGKPCVSTLVRHCCVLELPLAFVCVSDRSMGGSINWYQSKVRSSRAAAMRDEAPGRGRWINWALGHLVSINLKN